MAGDFSELLDEVDAAIFSGDALHDYDLREELRGYLSRWSRECDKLAELEEEENEPTT